ncbi:potassium-transporting ATPase subunit C [Conyzicola nivalis]|uniref:Potassium-transporting ATPase KdpC subunit n=1 Tax=Conyzicola nivalis TaxID=1477021 RepID=A0A916WHC7_9MICO|nr:potassium-transporting ATPase subunit KdpC [Conyzicola nivalis]GGA97229.1 potassium-transporting ATPase KdpC subunit [Conyzicola nivalis]
MSTQRGTIRQYWVAIRILAVFTLLLGVVYPLAITGVGQIAFGARANGSVLTVDGETVGSSLIGQSFADADGAALPEWFQSRPSAAGYDGQGSTGSNQGPESTDLLEAIAQRRESIASLEGVDPASVPADALTASASGLDPAISPVYARLQVARVAAERGLDESEVAALVESKIQGGDLGYLSEPTVNVLELNVALADLDSND